MKLLLIFALSAFFLTSCQTFYTTDASGTAVITPNSFKLPPAVGVMQRSYVKAFDGRGLNVGVGYDHYSQDQKTALTVFIRSIADLSAPSSSEQQQYFQASRQDILSMHKNARETQKTRINGHGSNGSLSEFRYDTMFARTPQRVASFLAVFRDGNRLVKYRITGPEEERDKVYSSLVNAVQTLSKIN